MTLTAYGMGAGFSCMVCGMDLWDVGRYVSAGAVVICDSCIGILKDAVDGAEGSGNTEVMLPPRTSGPVPDDSSAAAIAKAFVMTFGSEYDELDDYLEAASELGPVLAQAGAQFGGARFTTRVNRIRFTDSGHADVRFQVCMNGALTGWPFQGTAVRGEGGHWRVTRETVWRVVPGGGGPGPRRFFSG